LFLPTAGPSTWLGTTAAVKDTLSNPENNYDVLASGDSKMTADYNVKHAAHVTISGAILQRTNHVTLVSEGAVCEMQVVSNWSGIEHSDRSDFKKRVDESLAKLKNAPPPQPAEPAAVVNDFGGHACPPLPVFTSLPRPRL